MRIELEGQRTAFVSQDAPPCLLPPNFSAAPPCLLHTPFLLSHLLVLTQALFCLQSLARAISSAKDAFLEDTAGLRETWPHLLFPTPGPARVTLTCAQPGKPYLSELRGTMVLLPGARTFLLPAADASTPATAHETLRPQAAPTGEEVAAAGALDRYLEDLGMAEGWLRGGWRGLGS